MNDQDIQLAIEQIELSNNKDVKVSYYLNNFIISAINFDEYKFNRLFIKALNEFDFIVFYKVIILPLLQRVGLLWLTNKMSPSQEHFLSELIKQKLYTLIDRTAVNNTTKEKWLLFLPENEFHEIGLLFAKYILSLKEFNVLYLEITFQLTLYLASLINIRLIMFYFFFLLIIQSKCQKNILKSLAKYFLKVKFLLSLQIKV